MANQKSSLIILGIDPGIADTGFGILEKTGDNLKMLSYGCIKTTAKEPMNERLLELYQSLNVIIKKHQPQIVSVEKLFFAKNAKTALTVGQARGVILLAVGHNKLKIEEFTPLQVKMAVTSYGQASKKQVQHMVKVILNLKTPPKSDDAADALAIAICCANSMGKMS